MKNGALIKQNNDISRAKIPHELWQQVTGLFGHYPNKNKKNSKFKKYQTSKAPLKNSPHPQPTFIPINIPQSNEEIETNFIGKLEIKRPDGAVIFIERVNQKTLTMLLTQFMQGL